MKKNDINNSTKNYLIFSGFAIQMWILIYLGAWSGKKLDSHYETPKPYFTISLIFLAFMISMFVLLRMLKNQNKN